MITIRQIPPYLATMSTLWVACASMHGMFLRLLHMQSHTSNKADICKLSLQAYKCATQAHSVFLKIKVMCFLICSFFMKSSS